MTEPCRIFVVLDREYGQRLNVLAPAGPVWVVDTPTNRSVAEKSWAENQSRSFYESSTYSGSQPKALARAPQGERFWRCLGGSRGYITLANLTAPAGGCLPGAVFNV